MTRDLWLRAARDLRQIEEAATNLKLDLDGGAAANLVARRLDQIIDAAADARAHAETANRALSRMYG